MAEVLEGTGWCIERTIQSEGKPQYIAIIRKEPVSPAGDAWTRGHAPKSR
jgi:hypothetical protein